MQESNVCAVKGCLRNYLSQGVKLFRFPKDRERCKQWATLCDQLILFNISEITGKLLYSSYYRVCNKHFDDGMYATKKRQRLREGAIPTKLLPVSVSEVHLGEVVLDKNIFSYAEPRSSNLTGNQVFVSSPVKNVYEIPSTRSSSGTSPLVLTRKRQQDSSDMHCNEVTNSNTGVKESKDPVDTLSKVLVNILDEMCNVPGIQPFLYPVNRQLGLDYYQVVTDSMNLQTIRDNLEQRRYHSRGEFLTDVKQIVENSYIYKTKCEKCSYDRNGRVLHLDCRNSQCVTQKMLNICLESLNEKNQELLALERAINPLMFNEDQIVFTAILESVLGNKLKSMPEALPFCRPVNKSLVKDYYAVVTEPMDLETISKKVAAHKYHSRHEFLADFEQILHNCILYNGRDSQFTDKATQLVTACKSTLDKFDEGLAPLEKNLLLAQVKATENNDENLMSRDENYNQNSVGSASFVKSEMDVLIDIKQEESQGVGD